MHHAQAYVDAIVPGGFLNRPLAAAEAVAARQALLQDAGNYLYSAMVSASDALQAIERSMFTWATVKLYYTAFYLLRAHLALEGHALIYSGSKPFTLNCTAGHIPVKKTGGGTTHQAVVTHYYAAIPASPLLSQNIGLEKPFDWLMHRREEVNYKAGRFLDPLAPVHFRSVEKAGVRRSVAAYVDDTSYLYAFDPDHAMVALPIETFKLVLAHPGIGSYANIEDEPKKFLQGACSDRRGPLADMLRLLRLQ